MYIYRLTQDTVRGYDTYDAMVVIAENEDAARRMHPYTSLVYNEALKCFCFYRPDNLYNKYEAYPGDSWPNRIEDIEVEYLGVAHENAEPEVVVASFNAG